MFRAPNAYEQLMGRWSRMLARPFIDFAGLKTGERVLDVGCGAGSLTFALAGAADLSEIVAIDYSPVFVEEAARRNTDPRITIRQADACDLPFEDGAFDRALSLLVLHFVPEAGKAVSRDAPRRAARRHGCGGGLGPSRRHAGDAHDGRHGRRAWRERAQIPHPLLLPADDAAGRNEADFRRPGGLMDVTETQLMIRMDVSGFRRLLGSIAAGEGPLGKYVAGLDTAERARTEIAVRGAYEAGRPDGPRSFASVAWACRGVAL